MATKFRLLNKSTKNSILFLILIKNYQVSATAR